MQAPSQPTNSAERAIGAFYQAAVSKDGLVQQLMPEMVHIPMDRPPMVDEHGNEVQGEGLCLSRPSGEKCLVLVTSYPMFAPLAQEFPQFTRVFANYSLETLLVYTQPGYGFLINPRTSFEFHISAQYAESIRGSLG